MKETDVFEQLITEEFITQEIENEIIAKFYDIMRKYGIKKGTKHEDGSISMNNFIWTAAESSMLENIKSNIQIKIMFDDTPEDLIC